MTYIPLTEDAQALRDAAKAAFAVLFPHLDYEDEERKEFPNYQTARRVAAAIIGLREADHPRVMILADEDIAFAIGYALKDCRKRGLGGPTTRNGEDPRVRAIMDRLRGIKFERHLGPLLQPFVHIGQGSRDPA